MEFLKDQFQKRELQGNVPVLTQTQPTCDDEDNPNSNIVPPDPAEDESGSSRALSPLNTTDETTTPQTFAAPQKRVTKMNNATVMKKLMKLEEEKLKVYKERNNSAFRDEDPDYHFLMSLLPYLRKVPQERKMFVRTKLQQVFCEEEGIFGSQHTSTPQPTHSQRNHSNRSFSPHTSPTSDSWASGSQVDIPLTPLTPLSAAHCDGLASYFSNVTPGD